MAQKRGVYACDAEHRHDLPSCLFFSIGSSSAGFPEKDIAVHSGCARERW